MPDQPAPDIEQLGAVYAAFNARGIDATFDLMASDLHCREHYLPYCQRPHPQGDGVFSANFINGECNSIDSKAEGDSTSPRSLCGFRTDRYRR